MRPPIRLRLRRRRRRRRRRALSLCWTSLSKSGLERNETPYNPRTSPPAIYKIRPLDRCEFKVCCYPHQNPLLHRWDPLLPPPVVGNHSPLKRVEWTASASKGMYHWYAAEGGKDQLVGWSCAPGAVYVGSIGHQGCWQQVGGAVEWCSSVVHGC